MAKVIDFDEKLKDITENLPHEVSELICLNCKFRYIGVYPERTLLKNLECEKCGTVGQIIKTGQTINYEGDEWNE